MIYSILFFLSGFAGLLYQIVWLRLAFSHFGIITPVLSSVVSVFMLGLELGSWIAGIWVGKRSERKNISWLTLYGFVELGIGLWAFAVPRWFNLGEIFLFGTGAMNSGYYLIASALTLSAALLPSCLLMGMTYPVMMAHWRQQSPQSETSFSYLYRANILGALGGALLTPLVLIELLGFKCTNDVGVCINVLIAILSFWASGKKRKVPFSPTTLPASIPGSHFLSSGRLLGALFVTGFVSMAYEVLWTRAFTMILGTTIYSFATIVVVYLAATWLGSSAYRRGLANHTLRPLPLLYAALTVSAFLPIFLNDPRLEHGMIGVGVSLVPFCAFLGYITSCLVDRFSRGRSKQAGQAYAVNIAGCVLGPLLASYVLLPTVGARMGILWLSFLIFGLAISREGIRKYPRATLTFLAVFLVCAYAGAYRCSSFEEWGDGPTEKSILRRDYAATVVSSGTGFNRQLFVNGVGITVLTPLAKVMAHLPIFCHRGKPETALVICFGMGTTYRSLLSWGLKTTAVELVPSVRDAFGYYYEDADRVMRNPLGHVVIDDGRRYLQRTTDTFDIITLDPPPPVEAAGSGLLYSTEFYSLVKKRLKPNGILQQWWPGGEMKILLAVAQSLHASFPYVRVYKGLGGIGFHFLASNQEIGRPTLDDCLMRMMPGARIDLLEWNPGWKLSPLVEPIFAHEIPIERFLTKTPMTVTDDHPMNEYYLLRRWMDRRKGQYVVIR